jgi:enoyl-CoA hydratase
LCLTGRRFGPDEALALGLINRVVPAAELESSVADFAADLAKLPPGALATIKRTAWTLADMDLDRGLRYARDVSSLRALTDEARAGIEGFLKRAAR